MQHLFTQSCLLVLQSYLKQGGPEPSLASTGLRPWLKIPNGFAELMVRGTAALVLQESPLGADADRVADPRGDPERTPTPSFSRAARLPPSPQRSRSDAVRLCKHVGEEPAGARRPAPREVHEAMAAGEHVVEVPVPHQAASSAISCSGG